MARLTEFFRLFLVHFHERRMVIIVWQMFGGLFRGVEEKEEKAAANDNKYQVVQKNIFAFVFVLHFLRQIICSVVVFDMISDKN